MRKQARFFCFYLVFIGILNLVLNTTGYGWGSFAHRKIGDIACDAVPEPLKSFYTTNRQLVSQHSVDPDS